LDGENFKKTDVTEIKVVGNLRMSRGCDKKRGKKMSQNFRKSLKTHVEKMSIFSSAIIFMKMK
jgi:hypothetical protein